MKKLFAMGALGILSANAGAAIITVSESDFSGTYSEGFESVAGTAFYTNERILNDGATATGNGSAASGRYYIAESGNWSLNSTNNGWTAVLPQDGDQFAAIYGTGFIDIAFDFNATSFGGYFADMSTTWDTTFDFYDSSDSLIQSFTVDFQSLAGEMTWAGFVSDTAFRSVRISGYETAMDSLRAGAAASSVPEPGSLALLGLSIAGLGFSRRKKTA